MPRAVEECRGEPVITNRAEDLKQANYILLPGVGAFGDGMRNIRDLGLDRAIREEVLQKEIPFLGICLGMQLLASRGHEGGEARGLDLISGEVVRFEPNGPGVKLLTRAMDRPSSAGTAVPMPWSLGDFDGQ